MNICIKKFDELTPYELYKIIKLRIDAFMVDEKCLGNDLDDVDYECYHAFIEDGGEVIAYGRIIYKGLDVNEVYFGRIVCNKNYRRKGYTSILINKMIEFTSNDMGRTLIKLKSQSYVVSLYKKLNFIECSEEYLYHGRNHIDMVYMLKKDAK